MRFVQSTCSILCLCLLGLSACGTASTLYIGVGDAFGPGDGGVEVLEAATGNQLQYADLHSAATSSPAVIRSWLFVGAHDGNLYAFVRSGSSLLTPRTNTSEMLAD